MNEETNQEGEEYFLKDLRFLFLISPIIFLFLSYLGSVIFKLYDLSNVGAHFAVFIFSAIIVFYGNNIRYAIKQIF